MAFGDVCNANFCFFMHKAYYLNVSWGINVVYKGLCVSGFLHEDTRAKMLLTDKTTDADMLNDFHPSQLEKRFGGQAETPTNFWPPFVGKEFVPEKFRGQHPVVMQDDEYRKVLEDNPELLRHPDYMNSSNCPSRDFIYSVPVAEPQAKISFSRRGGSSQHFSERRSTDGRSSAASVYYDAYTGDEAVFFQMKSSGLPMSFKQNTKTAD